MNPFKDKSEQKMNLFEDDSVQMNLFQTPGMDENTDE